MAEQQNRFLDAAVAQKVNVSVFLINGIKLKGVVKGHDSYTVLLSTSTVDQLLYKHAISTVVPEQAIKLE